ncbi:MAG: Clp protease N-terminal domain-containing protein [Gemmataceae bacterium]
MFLPSGQLRPDLLTEAAVAAMHEALRLTRGTQWDSVRSPHVFMGLLAVPDAGVRNWAERLGANLPELLHQFQELFHQHPGHPTAPLRLSREFFSDNVIRLLREAQQRAQDNQRARITPMDLLISLLTAPHSIVAECFECIGVTAAKLTEMAVMAEQHANRA